MIIVFIFLTEVSPKATSLVNEVNIAVLGFDKLQPIPKHKLLGKTEFHMHKLAKVCDSRYLLKKISLHIMKFFIVNSVHTFQIV